MDDKPDNRLRLQCPHCSRTLKVPANLAGTVRRCPHCERKVRIPDAASVAGSVATSDDGHDDLFGAWEEKPAGSEWVPVVCEVCFTRIHATHDQIGTKIQCPDCGRANLVKKPAKPSPKWQPEWDGDEIQISAEPSQISDERRISHARELLMAAHEQLAEEVSTTDPPESVVRRRVEPNHVHRPLLPFFMDRNVWPQWIGILLGGLVVSALFDGIGYLARGQNFEYVFAIFFGLLAALVAVFYLSFVATRLLDVLEMTANETESDIIEWPDYDVMGRFGQLLFVFNALGFAAIPGGILAGIAASTMIRGIAVGVSIYLLFPLSLLSMVDHGSVMAPYSERIWKSIERAPMPWISFYLRSGVLLVVWAIVVGTCGLAWPLRGVSVLATVLMSWIYMRWLGQLGAYCLEVDTDSRITSPKLTEE